MIKIVPILIGCLLIISCQNVSQDTIRLPSEWSAIVVEGKPTARHEASFVRHKNHGYLIGGRRVNPVDQFDPNSRSWRQKSVTPIELHHFQAVSFREAIYILGAFTGGWPSEQPVEKVIKYFPEQDRFEYSHSIPENRRRGATAAVAHQGKIYVVGGIINGHISGTVPWFDQYDPESGEWVALPDAPHARDHAQTTVIDNKLYMVAGRKSSNVQGLGFSQTIAEVDVYDFATQSWSTLPENSNLPTERAGNMVINWNDKLVVAGGESGEQIPAHKEVEVYEPQKDRWSRLPDMLEGRHGTGLAIFDNALYVASGCAMRGGEPELYSVERLPLPEISNTSSTVVANLKQWHTLTLTFEGPQTSETADLNPFTDYRLQVDFYHPQSQYSIRGFYAADGNAADTGADSGSVWKVRFTPDHPGLWQYQARLVKGQDVAIELTFSPKLGMDIPIANSNGQFIVQALDESNKDFKTLGRLTIDQGYYKVAHTNKYWLKGGANSPENLLAFSDFDDTYRLAPQSRDGEASAGGQIHTFAPHAQDWQTGDPTWKGDKGKNLIGAINYLASMGMNSIYFLTMNINGDGKDVWPYLSPDQFDRFDVSKLAQWNRVFEHMQAKGIMLHMVLQETENELLLDKGETGRYRKLYFSELIARFGHHNGLTWNLGEENGPASWSPNGQNDQQRKDMASFIRAADPYHHPILLHTHSTAEDKEHLLPPLLGFEALDGLSFQVDQRTRVNEELTNWRKQAADADHDWLISMDEIGLWHTGALNDFEDPSHDTLRQHALWGSLMAGGAGVEWYFGGKHPNNDLTSENWRYRHNLWLQTKIALDFFNTHLPFWDMRPAQELLTNQSAYAFAKKGEVYLVYLPAGMSTKLNLGISDEEYSLMWFDPKSGGELQQFGPALIKANTPLQLELLADRTDRDWVALIQKQPIAKD